MDRLRRLLPIIVPLALTVVAGLVLFLRLDEPGRIVFDETYYVNDARQYLAQGIEDSRAVHPPVGKWLIAGSIALLGDDPVGWRAAGALAGIAIVVVTYVLGRRLLGSVLVAGFAGLLVATDGLMIVQARTSMLDVFLALFVLLAAWLVVLDLDRVRDGLPGRWRWAAGVALGLAIATKWSGLLALAAAGLLLLVVSWRRGGEHRWRRLGSVVVAIGVVPLLVYGASYVPWIANVEHSWLSERCPPEDCDLTDRLGAFAEDQVATARFHLTLDAEHSYRAPAYTWAVLQRPVVYYYESCDEQRLRREPTTDDEGNVTVPEPCEVALGEAAEIMALGNPGLWWSFLPATALLAAGWGRRDRRALVVGVFWLLQFLPWLVVSRPLFVFYMAPVVPFLALTLAYAVTTMRERVAVGGAAVGALVGGTAGFVAGLGLERLLGDPTARWGLAGAVWLTGAALGGWLDLRAERRTTARQGVDGEADASALERADARTVVRARPVAGLATAIAVTTAAIALFAYFYPVWTAAPLPEDRVRDRWWVDSWI